MEGNLKVKLFTLAYDNDRRTFDDGRMVAFLADKEALSVSPHFFVAEQIQVMIVLVTYREEHDEHDGDGPSIVSIRGTNRGFTMSGSPRRAG